MTDGAKVMLSRAHPSIKRAPYIEGTLNEIIQQLQAEGYLVSEIIPDGKVKRFSVDKADVKKSGYYIAYRNFSEKTGEEFFVVVYGSWRDAEPRTLCTLKGVQSAADRKNIKQKMEDMRKREQAMRDKEYEVTAQDVAVLWERLEKTGSSDYLRKKQVADCPHLEIRYSQGDIYVPARDVDGRVWSFQRIGWDGVKRFHAGGRIRGCFHIIGDITNSDDLFLTEGFATAASIYLATGRPVACCFTANNLVDTAANLKKYYPSKSIVVCGDDDRWKDPERNPGRERADLAARTCLGKAIYPKFSDTTSQPTDFNDLHVLEGLEKVKEQLVSLKAERSYLFALGFKEKEYFFTSSSNQQIVGISRFAKSDFINLMPLAYWEALFPGSGAARVDWDEAMTSLMDQARKRGIFESQNIRGAGVWNDDGRVVINMGDHLIVDGYRFNLGEIKSRYFYTLGIRLPTIHPSPLTAGECEVITDACKLFKWKKPDFGFLLAGALVTTRVCGALPIRPHIWLTGEKGSGKTTLFNRLIYPLIGEPLIFAGGNSTEAGIRQEVCANAVPVLFDEFENMGGKSTENIQSVLDLMRLAWSETKASVIKGGSSGVATSYRARFAAIVTSIRQVSMTDADRSRFATIELDSHGNDQDHWRELDALLSRIDLEYGNRLLSRTIKLLPVLLENFLAMKKALNKKAPGQRFGDQYGMILAGYGILMQDELMTEAQADFLAGHVCLEEERAEATITDQGTALNHLLTTKCRYEAVSGTKEASIGELIHVVHRSPHACEEKALQQLGIKVDFKFVNIASTHSELEMRVFRGTQWSKSWTGALSRLLGAEKNKPVWLAGRNMKCVKIPIATVLEAENLTF